MANNKNLPLIAEASSVSLEYLHDLVNFLEPPSHPIGIRVVLSRLSLVLPWLKVFSEQEQVDQKLHDVLDAVLTAEDKWSHLVSDGYAPRANIPNLLTGRFSQFPLYSLFTELKGDEKQDLLVAPFLALFILAFKANVFSDSLAISVGRNIRNLFHQDSVDGSKLLAEFRNQLPDTNKPEQIFEVAIRFGMKSWLKKGGFLDGAPKKKQSINRLLRSSSSVDSNGSIRHSTQVKRPQIWRSSDSSLKALSPDEIGVVEEVVIAPPNSDYDVELEQRRLSLHSEMDHQYLLWRWQHLNPNEVQWLKNEICSLILGSQGVGFLLALSASMARKPSDITSILICNDPAMWGSDTDVSQVYISPKYGIWSHPSYQPPDAYYPDEEAKRNLLRVGSRVILFLPDVVIQACNIFFPSDRENISIGNALKVTPDMADDMVNNWCRGARLRSGYSRITSARIRDWAFQHLLGVTQDPSLTAHLFWFDSGHSSSVYYATYSSEQLQQHYAQVMTEIVGETSTYAYQPNLVGSQLALSLETVSAWIKRWKDELAKSKKGDGLETLIAEHNSYVNYCLMMLMFSTGHRDVTDPFEDLTQFDEKTNTVVIADKMDGGRDDGRLVWLSNIAIKQFQSYVTHLKGLASRLTPYEVRLSERIMALANGDKMDLPLFFYLQITTKKNVLYPIPTQITPQEMCIQLKLPVPLNWTRHYLSTQLRKMGVPPEYIHYQLNHVKRGQRFDGPYSVLGVRDVGEVLVPALEQLSNEVGWTVISGIKAYSNKSGREVYEQKSWVLGSVTRAKRRSNYAKKFKERLKQLINEIEVGVIDENYIQSLEAIIQTSFVTKSEQLRAQRVLFRVFSRHSPQIESLLRRHWSLSIVMPRESSIFSLKHIKRLKRGREIKEKLRSWAGKLDTNKQDDYQWMGLLLATAIMEGGLIQQRFQNQFVSKFNTHCFTYKAMIWFEFDDDSYSPTVTRRWFPDPMTALILIKLRRQGENTTDYKLAKIKKLIVNKLQLHSFDEFLSISSAVMYAELPAYLAHYASGRIQSASLPEKAWLRLISGMHFPAEDLSEITNSAKRSQRGDVPIIYHPSYQLGQEVRREVRVLLKEAENIPNRYSRESLSEHLHTIITKNKISISPFLTLFLSWILQILRDGRYKPELAISTVRNYFLGIGRHLYEATWSCSDVETLDEDDFIGFYQETLDLTTQQNRPSNAALIEDFHRYLNLKHGLSEIDFADVEPNRKGQSVRPNLLSEYEYEHIHKQLPLGKRVVMSLAYKTRLRGKEIRQLNVADIKLEGQAVINVRSTARKRTKTLAGIRQFPLQCYASHQELDDIELMSDLCTTNDIDYLVGALPEGYNRELQAFIRKTTGDDSIVNYDMRHSAVTLSILKSTLMPEDWPPGIVEDERVTPEYIDAITQNNFGSTEKTRRLLYQQAMQTGHRSPSTTLASYTHLLDWTLHRTLMDKQVLSYDLLETITRDSSTNLRKVRQRSGSERVFKSEVVKKALKDSDLSAPPQVEQLMKYESIKAFELSQQPESLRKVLESIRLYVRGNSPSMIAQQLEVDEKAVIHWLNRAPLVEKETGFLFETESQKSWLTKQFSSEIEQLDRMVCGSELIDLEISTLRDYFHRFYQSHLDAMFFYEIDEVRKWVNSLSKIGIPPNEIVIIIPDNHSFYRNMELINPLLETLGLNHFKLIPKAVNVRTWHAKKHAGIGVKITSLSNFDKRVLLQTELYLLLFAACCLVDFSEE